jgi:hypothetical protein
MKQEHYEELSQQLWKWANEEHERSRKPAPGSYQEAWDRAGEEAERQKRHHVPRPITSEEAKAQFSKVARSALYALTGKYANSIRQQNKLQPLRMPPMPASVAQWIEKKLNAIDGTMGHPGAHTYQGIVNGLLSQLRSVESHFLGDD